MTLDSGFPLAQNTVSAATTARPALLPAPKPDQQLPGPAPDASSELAPFDQSSLSTRNPTPKAQTHYAFVTQPDAEKSTSGSRSVVPSAPTSGSSFLHTLKKGTVQEQEKAYHDQFRGNLLGNRRFRELVDDSLREAGLDNTLVKVGNKERKLTAVMLGTPEILAQLPQSAREKFQKSLSVYLNALSKETAVDPVFASVVGSNNSISETSPDKIKSATVAGKNWQQTMPEITRLKEEQTRFNSSLTSHIRELAQDTAHFAAEAGLALPAEITAAYQTGDALKGKQLMQEWLSQQRVACAQNPQKLRDLEGLEHFALQLDLSSGIQNRVARGEQIDDALIQQYERFQAFLQTKQALTSAYAQAGPDQRPALREALFSLGKQFAGSEQKPIEAFRQDLARYLDRSLGAPASAAIPAQLAQQEQQFQNYNQVVQTAHQQGVMLVNPESQPARISSEQLTQDLSARLTRLAHSSSNQYRQVFLKGGDKALVSVLAREQSLVLKPLALRTEKLQQLLKDFQDKTLPALKALQKPALQAHKLLSQLPNELQTRLARAKTPEQFAGEVKKLQDDLRKSMASYKAETRQIVLAQLMMDWMKQHIDAHYQEHRTEADQHQSLSLAQLTEQTQGLIEQALLASAAPFNPALTQMTSAWTALLTQSEQGTPPILSHSDTALLQQVLKTEL